MFERFLFFIFFSYKKNPDYSTFPDMKDALAVLGAFCEKIIRSKENQFSKSEFIKYSNDFCENYSITVDSYLLFDLMRQENIIVGARDNFWFRYVHWVYFFGAHRMHHEKAFCDFVLTESRYMNYPEIIEFYSGVDRRRGELLEILTSDLQTANRAFEARTKILANFDPYENAEWSMSEDRAEKLRQNLEEESKQTSLPVSIKDQIADRNFDRTAPYKQEMKTFANDSSLLECMQILTASARALRNSDYVDSAIKHRLMDEILRAWVKEIQILFLLSPILARERSTVFDNIHFYITESLLHDTDMETWEHLAYVIPTTVFALHEKDIASPRMLPMFREILAHGDPKPEHFLIAAVLITNRPNGWEAAVKLYIQKLSKNSFYLMKIMNLLEHQYKFGFAAQQDKSALFELMAVVIAKHSTGSKMPNKKMVKKAKEQLETKEKSKN